LGTKVSASAFSAFEEWPLKENGQFGKEEESEKNTFEEERFGCCCLLEKQLLLLLCHSMFGDSEKNRLQFLSIMEVSL